MNKLLFIITVFTVLSCSSNWDSPEGDTLACDTLMEKDLEKDSLDEQIISDYDMSTVDKKNSKEFKENLVKIEKQFGEQWGFCDCVIKNDSINKAFSKQVSDTEFDRLSERFDEIDQKCKAFLAQNPSTTPEDRAKHEKKVKKCLKEAGIR